MPLETVEVVADYCEHFVTHLAPWVVPGFEEQKKKEEKEKHHDETNLLSKNKTPRPHIVLSSEVGCAYQRAYMATHRGMALAIASNSILYRGSL